MMMMIDENVNLSNFVFCFQKTFVYIYIYCTESSPNTFHRPCFHRPILVVALTLIRLKA